MIHQHIVPKIGEIYNMYFSGEGSVQTGWRPGLVFQNNVGNANSPNIIALPLTSCLKKTDMPTHVLLKAEDAGLRCDSVVICENPQTLPKERIGKFITQLSPSYMHAIVVAHLTATSAISFLDEETLLQTWRKAVKLNSIA